MESKTPGAANAQTPGLSYSDFTPEFAQELLNEYGTAKAAAEAIAKDCHSARYGNAPVTPDTVRGWLGQVLAGSGKGSNQFTNTRVTGPGRIKTEVIGSHEVLGKDKEVVTLHDSKITLVREAPSFPLIQPATPTSISYNSAPYISRPVSYHAVISDAQIGYIRDQDTGKLEPIHDPAAMDVAKQIVSDIRPVGLEFIGDWMDWPTFSRWQKYPEFWGCVQPSIETGYEELGEFIAAAGAQCTKRIMIGSNHGQRPEKFLLEYNMDAMGIKRAHARPDSWPVFSEPYLLRYDELGIEFSGQYPGGEYYLLPDLVLTHAPPKKLEFAASVIHGHTHHLTRSTVSQYGSNGRQNYFVFDTGCLCQLGSTENKRRLSILKVPSDRARNDWAQGISIVSVIGGKSPRHAVEQISILDGRAIYQGKDYRSMKRG